MIASLPMYDRPETAGANDRFWQAIRDHLGFGPAKLTRGQDPWDIWRAPDLLLAQTCGLPFRTQLQGHVTLVCTPDYGLPGCPPGHYNSVLVAHRSRANDPLTAFDAAHLAVNEPLSQSGWAAPYAHFSQQNLRIGRVTLTGAHRDSARLVASQEAELAALDALTWELIRQFDAFANALVEIERTDPTPALPLITAKTQDPAPLRHALECALTDLNSNDSALLRLQGFKAFTDAQYLTVPTPPAPEITQ